MAAGKTLYIKDAAYAGSSHGTLSADASSIATTGTGWIVGTTVATRYSVMQYNSEQAAATFGAGAQPPTTLGTSSAWISDCFYGSFAAGNWTFSFPVISVTNGATGTVSFRVRVFKGSDVTGSDAVELTTSAGTMSSVANLTTSTAQISSGTISMPRFSLNNERIFISCALAVTVASDNAAADVLIRTGSDASVITSTFSENLIINSFQKMATIGGNNFIQPWANGEPRSFKDVSGNKELIVLGVTDRLYLYKSSDSGKTWSSVAPTGGERLLYVTEVHGLLSCAQDLNGKVHILHFSINDGIRYTRIALSYTASSVTGFASEVKNITMAGTYDQVHDVRGSIAVIKDQSNTSCLACMVNDNPSASFHVQMCKTLNLVPAATTDFTKLDGTSGATEVYNSETFNNHDHNSLFAQAKESRDMWVFFGAVPAEANLDDPVALSRIKLTANGDHTWSVGSVSTSTTSAQLLSLCVTDHYVWCLGNYPVHTITIDRVGLDDTFDHLVVSSPCPNPEYTSWGMISVSSDETKFYVAWDTWTSDTTYQAYWNGVEWFTSANTTIGDCWGMASGTGWNNGVLALLVDGSDYTVWTSTVWERQITVQPPQWHNNIISYGIDF